MTRKQIQEMVHSLVSLGMGSGDIAYFIKAAMPAPRRLTRMRQEGRYLSLQSVCRQAQFGSVGR